MSKLTPYLLAFAAGACTAEVTVTTKEGDDAAPPATATATATVEATATATATTTAATPKKVCTEIGCVDSLEVAIRWDKDALTAGKYVFEVEADGKKGSCEVRYPMNCDKPTPPTCSGDVKLELKAECNEVPLTKAKTMNVGPLHIVQSAPAKVAIKVMRDKVQMGKTELAPKYATVTPNGPDCSPKCQQAKEEICVGKCAK